MGLFDIFKKTNSSDNQDDGTLFYHEDDFCRIELKPIENIKWLSQELTDLDNFSEEIFASYGWTKMYVPKSDQIKLLSRKINPNKLLEIINKTGFTKATTVTTGYGQTTREDCPSTFGFGRNYSAVYFSTMFDLVDHIWFTNLFSLDREKTIQLLHEIGKEWNLILVDWQNHRLVSLADTNEIKNYFDADN